MASRYRWLTLALLTALGVFICASRSESGTSRLLSWKEMATDIEGGSTPCNSGMMHFDFCATDGGCAAFNQTECGFHYCVGCTASGSNDHADPGSSVDIDPPLLDPNGCGTAREGFCFWGAGTCDCDFSEPFWPTCWSTTFVVYNTDCVPQ